MTSTEFKAGDKVMVYHPADFERTGWIGPVERATVISSENSRGLVSIQFDDWRYIEGRIVYVRVGRLRHLDAVSQLGDLV